MAKLREILLAGTMLPVLMTAAPSVGAPLAPPASWQMAQAQPGNSGQDQRQLRREPGGAGGHGEQPERGGPPGGGAPHSQQPPMARPEPARPMAEPQQREEAPREQRRQPQQAVPQQQQAVPQSQQAVPRAEPTTRQSPTNPAPTPHPTLQSPQPVPAQPLQGNGQPFQGNGQRQLRQNGGQRPEPLGQHPPQQQPMQTRPTQPGSNAAQPPAPDQPANPPMGSRPQHPNDGRPLPGQPGNPSAPMPGQSGGPPNGGPDQGLRGRPLNGGPDQRLPGSPGGMPQGGNRLPGDAGPPNGGPPGQPPMQRQGGRNNVGGAIAAGAAAGLVGGFLAAEGMNRLDDVRAHRQEFDQDGASYIREPGRTIVREDNQMFIAHDENQRFRDLGYDVRSERRGRDNLATYATPDGSQILTFTDDNGRLLRRIRRFPDGREIVLIDNGPDDPGRRFDQDVVDLPPPPIDIPQDRYYVDADQADEGLIYDTIAAPPVAPITRRYTLDQVRYSQALRARMRSINIDTINFDTGSWTVTSDQAGRLNAIAQAILQAVRRNPQEIFLVEGYTDAVGSDVDNLSLSDRRAQSVAAILTRNFQVPPENLTTQGYGSQFPKVATNGASAANRRVTLQRITPLLASQK